MSGIIFFKTKNLDKIKTFFCSEIGMELWLDQQDCVILQHGNMLLGFCDRDKAEHEGMITFFYETTEEVDLMYQKLESISISMPIKNEKYSIYQFFARDPEDRTLEFQCFLHPLPSHLTGSEILINR
jgi:hypothetical protein